MSTDSIQEKAINTIKFLSVDGVQTANSGHPGLPMGDAGIAYALWMKLLRYNPKTLSGLTVTVLFFQVVTVLC